MTGVYGLLPLLGLMHLATPVQDFVCPPQGPPAVTITLKEVDPNFSHARTSDELEKLRKGPRLPLKKGEIALLFGLTLSDISMHFQAQYRELKEQHSGLGCISVASADVLLLYKPSVYIAKESPFNSCPYNTTVDHELQHVMIDTQLLHEYMPFIETAIKTRAQVLEGQGPYDAAMMKEMQDYFSESLNAEVQKWIDVIGSVRAERQSKIDTREEYDRLSGLCGPDGRGPVPQ